MNTDNKCPKCSGEFEEGIIASFTGMLSNEVKWGTGISKITGALENQQSIKNYRCKNCGYLENYAQ
jgi:predicted nucleic-acid-binding Zn-ribbon protein